MIIKIIGSNTINGIKLRKRIIEIANCCDGKVTINLIENYTDKQLPYLYINNKLISKGIVPNRREIEKYLKNNNNL